MHKQSYYHAYNERYKQVHKLNPQWFDEKPSSIVLETICEFSIQRDQKLLEIGCGEGRDAFPLLEQGYNLLATDVSSEAITFCQGKIPDYKKHFQILDCITDSLRVTFDFIYAVAVIHMLVLDADRNAFYHFIYDHLSDDGVALICSMGDGTMQRQTDINTAFDIQDRIHEASGTPVKIASTSCRMVDFPTFHAELKQNDLEVIKEGITAIEPDFPQMMFAIVKKANHHQCVNAKTFGES